MAIDFSQVKTLTIPEGSVTKIQIAGVTVWENIPVLVSITISDQITSIDRGSEFVFGGTVTANYSNGSTADVTSSATLNGYDMSNSGTYTVTVSYTENDITVNATYELTVNKAWTTTYDNSSGMTLFNLDYPYSSWTTASSVPCNINDKTTQLRITYRQSYNLAYGGVKTVWNNNGSPAITDTSTRKSNYTRTFDYTQGKDIVYFTLTDRYNKKASCSWYKNGLWKGGIPDNFGMGGYLKIYKVEQYY